MITWMRTIGLVAVMSAVSLEAQKTLAPVSHVFLVDTSFSMARHKNALGQTLTALVKTGFNSQWREGERFTIWTFNEQVYNQRFQPQTWAPDQADALAQRVAQFLKTVRYEKQTRIGRAIEALREAVQSSTPVSVILFSDGDTTLSGTPFDRAINELYLQHRPAVRKSRQVLLTTFLGRDGQLLTWSVGVSRPLGMTPHLARADSSSPVPSGLTPPAQESTPPPKVDPVPAPVREAADVLPDAAVSSLILKSSAAEQPVSPPENPSPPPSEPLSRPVALSSSPSAAPPATEPIASKPEPESPRAVPASVLEAVVPKPDSSPEPVIVETSLPPRAESPSAEAAPADLAATTAPGTPLDPDPIPLATTEMNRPSSWLLISGLGLLVCASVLLAWFIRQNRPRRPSLISRSLDGPRGGE